MSLLIKGNGNKILTALITAVVSAKNSYESQIEKFKNDNSESGKWIIEIKIC